VVLADKQVPVQGHHDVGNVAAHFDRLAEIGHHDNLVVLDKLIGEDCGTKRVAQSPSAASHGVKYENETIKAIELGIYAHILVKVLF
jgi:hypothetical protein